MYVPTRSHVLRCLFAGTLLSSTGCGDPIEPIWRSPAALVKVSGDRQRGLVGQPVAEPLVVQAIDAHGNALKGVPVSWTTRGTGSGHISPDADRTDASGLVRATWLLGVHPDTALLAIASIDGDSAVFTAASERQVAEVKVLVPSNSAPSLTVLQSTVFTVRAFAYGEGKEWIDSPIAFSWFSSDTSIAVVRPLPPGEYAEARVEILRGGNVVVGATAQGVNGSIEVRALSVAPGFTAAFTGLWRADALNDAGEVAGWFGGRLHLWHAGEMVDQDLEWSPGLAQAMNTRRSILILRSVPGNTGAIYNLSYSALIRGGSLIWIPALWEYARAFDVDANDRVVGVLRVRDHNAAWNHGFLWENGHITLLEHATEPTSRYAQSHAVAINDSGWVVVNMTLHPRDAPWHALPTSGAAYLWRAGVYTPIPAPLAGCVRWEGADIDRGGRVLVNCVEGEGAPAAFLWNGSSFTPLAPLRLGSRLNDRGEVVGRVVGEPETYLWRNGETIRLFDAAVPTSGPLQINDRGQILLNTPQGGYVLTPDR